MANCKICGKETKNKKYCSLKCNFIAQKIPRKLIICPICNKEFEVIITSKRKYCSKKCCSNSRIGKSSWNKDKKGLQIAWNKDKKGSQVPWNKNKTKETDYRILKAALTRKRKILSGEIVNFSKLGRGISGRREDLDHSVRSSWEANVCRILNLCDVKYEYESKNCRFDLGEHTYICDLYLPEFNIWIEVKGYMYSDAKEKLKEFVKLYPNEAKNTKILDGEGYKELAKMFKDKIEFWE